MEKTPVMARIARLTASGLMLWPAAGMGAVSLASLFSGRPQSRVGRSTEGDPPELLMGLLISLGLISAVALIIAAGIALYGLWTGRGWKITAGMLATGYLTGSAAGFICFFMVGKGSAAADRGLELAGRYQLAAGIVLVLLAVLPALVRIARPVGLSDGGREFPASVFTAAQASTPVATMATAQTFASPEAFSPSRALVPTKGLVPAKALVPARFMGRD
ncbi:hypothetical protein [Actinocorallia longicatena]|uniref:Uncharacterized protein n=1 Tax=Actinocorallia longicatena TaxID=111803 RepID=A0ABP6QI98_9ACTN